MTCKRQIINFDIQLFVDMAISESTVLDINTALVHYVICLH